MRFAWTIGRKVPNDCSYQRYMFFLFLTGKNDNINSEMICSSYIEKQKLRNDVEQVKFLRKLNAFEFSFSESKFSWNIPWTNFLNPKLWLFIFCTPKRMSTTRKVGSRKSAHVGKCVASVCNTYARLILRLSLC